MWKGEVYPHMHMHVRVSASVCMCVGTNSVSNPHLTIQESICSSSSPLHRYLHYQTVHHQDQNSPRGNLHHRNSESFHTCHVHCRHNHPHNIHCLRAGTLSSGKRDIKACKLCSIFRHRMLLSIHMCLWQCHLVSHRRPIVCFHFYADVIGWQI